MKHKLFILVALVVVVMCATAFAEERIETYSGTLTDTLFNADSSGVLPGNIEGRSVIPITADGRHYDGLMCQFYVNTMTAISTNTSIGTTDTVIITVCSGKDYWEHVIFCDTGTLPCTLLFKYIDDPLIYGAMGRLVADSSSDSAWAGPYWYPQDTVYPALRLENLYWKYYVEDASGAGETCGYAINYWFKLIDEE